MSRIRSRYHDPEAEQHSIPTYWWKGAPDGYATRRQLRAKGLCPGGRDPDAQVLWRGVGGERAAYLYQVDLCRPKRTATPAVLASVAKALLARRTCPTCAQVCDYYIPRRYGECLDCAEPTYARKAA